MNPTFSSPVLQERVTYTWEDLQKAAAGVFTDTLKNEKARLESLAQKGIPLQDMPSNSLKLAMAVVATGPIILVYPFVQKYFVKGVTIGSVKG